MEVRTADLTGSTSAQRGQYSQVDYFRVADIHSRPQALPRRRRRLIVPGSQPGNADTGVTAEQHDQLTGVVLGVSQVVQQELAQRSVGTTGIRSARGRVYQSAS